MDVNVIKNASEILNNPNKLVDFATLNRITVQAAQEILQRLLEKPVIAEEVKAYIFSSDRSEDFKGYIAGEAVGNSKGHEAGFAKGAMLGVLSTVGVLTLAGLAVLYKKD